ncbi:MAG: DEAD/DEAH box helicase, partial [Rhizomicrobium sp.]
MPLSALKDPHPDLLGADPDDWAETLAALFADRSRHSDFLPLAESAVRACPGDAVILCLAATAALLDARPERAMVFLKRLSKRYEPTATDHLLQALALAQQKKFGPARALIERHDLDFRGNAIRAFPGDVERYPWLAAQLDAILGLGKPMQPKTFRGARKSTAKAAASRQVAAPPERRQPPSVAPASAPIAPTAPPRLPRPQIEIPITTEFDLQPLWAAIEGVPGSSDWFLLRENLAHFSLTQGFDELLCVPHLTGIETLWHQVETVRKVLKQFRGRVLLADEVGLGKTIEAGMVLKEYLLRGMAESALVLVPASLVGQWREELITKFGIACASTHDPLLREDPERFWSEPRIIASLALARRAEHARRFTDRKFDIVIVDEAHHLRDRSSQGYKLVDGLNKRFLLLLSATPVQNDLKELYNILTLLKPGIFKTLKEFRAAHMVLGKPRQPADPVRLRDLMRSAMIRNTRARVALRLPRRQAATLRVDPAPAEAEAYRELAIRVRELAAADSLARQRLALHHLLGAAGSSPAAAAAALERFAAGQTEPDGWLALGGRWATLRAGAKEGALLGLLRRNPEEKKLVFVRYRRTLDHLAELLTENRIGFACFDGSMSGPDKDAAIATFRDYAPVLLSTESGGEGRNIQFCNTLINFDVPWNPMAIEQRIGRIDRIGQQRDVFVFNLVTRGTVEEAVLR